MRLWDKGDPLDAEIAAFTVGDDPVVDLNWAWHDVVGSCAHVRVQRAAGLLLEEEARTLLGALADVLADIEADTFSIAPEHEDVHTEVEARLAARLGPVAGKLHTGRSRNDQVLTAIRLWQLEALDRAEDEVEDLIAAFDAFAVLHGDPLPGYTHLQRAMPSSWALWAAGFADALAGVLPAFETARAMAGRCPLGSAAGYGTPLPLDRALAARLLGFSDVEEVTASQLSRGLVEAHALGAVAGACHVVGRFAWDVGLYASAEFALLRLPDALTTGSSIMPQKRNPDVAELLRGSARRVRAAQREIEDLSAALPSGYHRDLQHTKAPLARGFDVGRAAIRVATRLVAGIEPLAVEMDPALYATAEAFARAQAEGRPFREVYREVGLEVKAGTFTPRTRPSAPAPRSRARRTPAAPRPDRRAAWRALADPRA
ncbi:MAG: lyase family protein [Myxococcota bacterium]